MADIPSLVLNLRDAFGIAIGTLQSLVIIIWFRPDAVFNKAGTVGLPVGIAARLLGVPMVIHEPDAAPGLGNRILSRWAAAVAVGFPAKSYRSWSKKKLVFTGTPVRQELLEGSRADALKHFSLDPDRPVVLVLGGSQGARAINRLVAGSLDQLTKRCQLIHVTGAAEYGEISKRAGNHYRVFAYLKSDFNLAYAAADLVVSRAGANTIAELALLSKPAILIPNRSVAAHQIHNAGLLGQADAAVVLDELSLDPEAFSRQVLALAADKRRRALLADHIAAFAKKDAADYLASLICRVAGER